MGSALSSLAGGAGGIGGSAAAVQAALAKIPSGPPPSAAVQQCLQSAVGKGTVAFSGAPSYVAKNVRPYNLNYIIIPAAVTYPTTAEEVAAIVKCAVDNHLGVQARSGGHSYANHNLGVKNGGSIVVDLNAFQQFSVDKSNWQATIGAGSLLGDIDQRLHSSGRAISHGTAPTIGIGGHATIGGLGPPGRMWGLTLDHVEEVEVVLANSSIVRASHHCNQDLFWAIRGAGASFGIVTEFKMRTEPEPGNAVVYSYNIEAGSTQQKANAFKAWQKLISDPKLSRRFASQFTLAEDVGAIIKGTFFGTQQEYDALNITSRLSTDPSSIQLKDWLGAMAAMVEEGVLKAIGNNSASFYSKSLPYTKNDLMSDETVDKLFKYIDSADKGGALWFFIWDLEGGAIADVPAHATAYGHRDALFFHQTYAVSLTGPLNETTRQFLRNVNQIVLDARGGRDNGAYPGYVDAELGRDSASLYWDGNAVRLQNIKGAYDPGNVFANPQSILPTRNVKRTITY